MTGGGFAGCAVALVAADAADDFIPAVQERYRAVSGLKASVWLSQPAAGASHIDSIGQHPE